LSFPRQEKNLSKSGYFTKGMNIALLFSHYCFASRSSVALISAVLIRKEEKPIFSSLTVK
jgi:hypothetical protein